MEFFCRNRGSCRWNYFLKSLHITVKVSVPIIYALPLNLAGNGSLVLFCNASGTDVSYQWFLNKKRVATGERICLSKNIQTLTISPCNKSDTGTILTCTASNAVSNATSSPFTTTVSYGKPDKDSLPVWAIPLIGIGVLVLLALLIGLMWYFFCRPSASSAQKEEQTGRKGASPTSSRRTRDTQSYKASGEHVRRKSS